MSAAGVGMASVAELRGWASRVLCGVTLDDKLAAPGDRVDELGVPDEPGRPDALRLPPPGAKVRAEFPARLDDPLDRGRVLHFFANHELMALELMARAILRFRDVPAPFVQGVAAMLQDEQRHLRLYVDRMTALGVTFGELPVNRYFWDALAPVDDPLAWVAGLALTLEQANLDFACHYGAAMRRVGDLETADALDVVLADEVRHVRHGVHWLDVWKPKDLSQWEAWTGALPRPLTPARARGPMFTRDHRLAAGLDADLVDRLAVWGGSGGRPPWVHSFHPGVETDVAGLTVGAVGSIHADLAPLMAVLATPGDVVITPRAPGTAQQAALVAAGFPAVEYVADVASLRGRTLAGCKPWGLSPVVARELAPLGCGRFEPRWRALYEKSWSAEQLAAWPDLVDPAVVGRVVRDVESLGDLTGCVVKAPLGTSGRGMVRPDYPGADGWIRRVLRTQGAVVVEPWLDRVVDLSLQFDVAADGSVQCQPWGRFLTDDRGRYVGAVLGRQLDDLQPELRAFLDTHALRLREVAARLGPLMRGYVGPAGLDALVYRRSDGAFALKPLVELNPRVTMGRIANAIGRRIRRGRVGLWTILSRRDVGDLSAWAAARPGAQVEGGWITGGVLCTTDPALAEDHLSALGVGATLAEARAALGL
jgi:uncharacterized ferritin-like protein (DUF455 family)